MKCKHDDCIRPASYGDVCRECYESLMRRALQPDSDEHPSSIERSSKRKQASAESRKHVRLRSTYAHQQRLEKFANLNRLKKK